MILPKEPGLARRLAYGTYIRNKNRLSEDSSYSEYFDNINIYYNEPTMTFDELSNLKDVEIGLSLDQLLLNTKIDIEYSMFFCSICQNKDPGIHVSRKLCCQHKFHINCIETWLSKNKSCPICRCDLS